MFSTIIVSVWQSLGFYILIYVAGMQGVPTELNESADLDGAGAVRRFFSITIPLIMPSISFCMFHSVANSLKMFELIFSLTGGGPGTSTTSIALDIYNSVILFIIVLVISVIQVNFFKGKEVEA